jgi:DNA-binding response OmpR family regulator
MKRGDKMNKIFIVEDEKTIRDELSIFLSRYGYQIEAPNNFENIIENIKNSNPDLILLDINLPIFDGYYLCREVRKFSETPIIVVTSRDSDVDELMSMNLGADDFVTKPYNTQILLARIESILKRVNRNLAVQDILEYKDIKVNLSNGTVAYNKKTVEITKNELKILSYLLKNRGNIVSREKLMNYLWDCEMFIDDNTLSVNVTRIRKKLEEIGVKDVIETRRGLGYIIS